MDVRPDFGGSEPLIAVPENVLPGAGQGLAKIRSGLCFCESN